MGIFDNYLRPKLDMDVTTISQAANALFKSGIESGVSAQHWANAIENAVRRGEIQTIDDFYNSETLFKGEKIKQERGYHGGVQLYTSEIKHWLDRNKQSYPAYLFCLSSTEAEPQVENETTPERQTSHASDKARPDDADEISDWEDDPNLTKLKKQQRAILEVIRNKKIDPMRIPDGEKVTIERICCNDYPLLFDTDSSFSTAWKKGRKLNLFKMANHASYAKRGTE